MCKQGANMHQIRANPERIGPDRGFQAVEMPAEGSTTLRLSRLRRVGWIGSRTLLPDFQTLRHIE
jgi:hypothetical protein